MSIRSLALVATTCLFVSSARAQTGPREETPVETESYGGLTLGVDALSLALVIGGGIAEEDGGRDTPLSTALWSVGVPATLLATPIVHALQGSWRRGLGSLGLRFALSSIGAGVGLGVASSRCGEDSELFCGFDGLGYGWITGIAVASVIDAAFIAKRDVVKRERIVAPTVAIGRGGGALGLAGAF